MKIIRQFKCCFAIILYLICSKSTKVLIDSDIKRYLKWNEKLKNSKNQLLRLNTLLLSKDEFRNVFYFRIKHHRFLSALSRFGLPKSKTVELKGDIGPGLFVSHHHCVICPEKSGHNLRVGPGAVIYGYNGSPVLGNNVYIASNAVVFGNIRIGDNVIVGAGSVVTSDLESNGVYLGNPVRFVKKIAESSALFDEIT